MATVSIISNEGALPSASAEAFLKSDCLPDLGCVISDVQMPGVSGIEYAPRKMDGELHAVEARKKSYTRKLVTA